MDEALIQARDPAPTVRSSPALRAWLIGTVTGIARFDGPVDDDTPLADEGLCLDSLGLFTLIVALEDHLGVKITEDDITEANFGTVGRLLRHLATRGSPIPG
jgi:acyl carrier protein